MNGVPNVVESPYPTCSCGAGKCIVLTEKFGKDAGRKYFACPIKKIQLVRIQLRVPEYGWTTYKVFHFLNFVVNAVRCVVFVFQRDIQHIKPEVTFGQGLKVVLIRYGLGSLEKSLNQTLEERHMAALKMERTEARIGRRKGEEKGHGSRDKVKAKIDLLEGFFQQKDKTWQLFGFLFLFEMKWINLLRKLLVHFVLYIYVILNIVNCPFKFKLVY